MYTDGFSEFSGQGRFFELEIQEHWGHDWNSEGMGGGGGLDLEFPQGKDESVFLENAYFIDLISLQTKHELTTLLMAAEDKHPLISDVFIRYSFVEENQQKVGFTSSSRKTCCKTSFFSLMKTAS